MQRAQGWGTLSRGSTGEIKGGAPGNGNEIDFTGDTQEIGSGLYDTPNRELHPTQGRWLSPDPAGLEAADPSSPQSWNRYAYAVNNPCSLIDPLGLRPTCTLTLSFFSQSANDVAQNTKTAIQQIYNNAGVNINFVDGKSDLVANLDFTLQGSVVGHNLGFMSEVDATKLESIGRQEGATQSQIDTAVGVDAAHEMGHFLVPCTHGGFLNCGNLGGDVGLMRPGSLWNKQLSAWDPHNSKYKFTRQQKDAIKKRCKDLRSQNFSALLDILSFFSLNWGELGSREGGTTWCPFCHEH